MRNAGRPIEPAIERLRVFPSGRRRGKDCSENRSKRDHKENERKNFQSLVVAESPPPKRTFSRCSPLRTAPRPQSIQSIQSTQSIQSIQSLAIRGAVSPPCLLLSFQISHPPTPRIWIKIEIHGANGRVVVARYFVGLG